MVDNWCEIWVPSSLRVKMRMQVNEPWCNSVSFSIDFSSATAFNLTNRNDSIVVDGNVAKVGF